MKYNFDVSLRGRVRNFSLPDRKALLPLFEAVVNSLQAIEDRKKKDNSFCGKISIFIERENTVSEEIIGRIDNITIFDNGIGFNEENFKSFLQSDSEYKIDIGGKGVGHFSWLKAFENVEIESVFSEDSVFFQRRFNFSLANSGIDDELIEIKDCNYKTSIKLCSFIEKYKNNAPIELDTIAIKLIQHCFVYFLENGCPEIIIHDNIGNCINLNDVFKQKVELIGDKDKFIIEDYSFELQKVKVFGSIIDKHKLYLCANNRLVDTKDLSKIIIDLDKTLGKEESFWFLGILTSNFLNENVDMNRLSFTIQESAEEGLFPVITLNKIIDKSIDIIKIFLNDYLEPIAREKKQKITNYILKEAPQYRHILKYLPEKLNEIKPSLSNDKLDFVLYEINREFEQDNKKNGIKIVNDLKNDAINLDEYKQKFEEHIAKISDENKSILAKYVAQRKTIIDLFEVGLRKKEDGKFVKEEFMHNLIYPMRTTSEEIAYEQHNLWLIDERLAYFFFATSDNPFNNDKKEDRPDIMLFDKSVALLESQNDGTAYDTIVIFELKKPMRDDLVTNNPVSQITKYMNKIKTNTVTDKNGRIIRTDSHTKFYLYIVCDMIEQYKEDLESTFGFDETIDKLGMFRMKDNQYIEVLTYDKIVNDAKKRNKILFDKLGL